MTLIIFSSTLTDTTIKLNGKNYLLRSQYFHASVGAKRKSGYLLDGLPDAKDPFYSNWFKNAYCVIIYLFNDKKEKVNSREIFLKTTKEIWNTFKKIYDNEKNIFRVFELFELLFTLQQGEISTPTYYSTLYDI